jgi:hypothetical protein
VRFVAEFMRLISNICVFVCQNGPPCETVNCEVILITIVLENKEFLYTDAEESIPCLDHTRLYYFVRYEAELYHCKTTTTELYVCTQSVAMCRHSQETWAVNLLHQRENISKSCETRLEELQSALGIKLMINELIYFVWHSDCVTNTNLLIGNLRIKSGCKVFTTSVLLQAGCTVMSDVTLQGGVSVSRFRASCISKWKYKLDATILSVLCHIIFSLYMFRVLHTPIIRSFKRTFRYGTTGHGLSP